MTDDALLWNHELPRLSQPRPRERAWVMRKDGREMEAHLLYLGEYGVEAQLFYRGEFYRSRRWNTKAEALAEADEKQRELEGAGWTLVLG
jgi:hypothetical protein